MQISKYIYTYRYDPTESDLCKLESRFIFDQEEKNRLLFSNLEVVPSSSAYIKKRLDIIAFANDHATLLDLIQQEEICIEGFKIEYLVFDGDTTEYAERLAKLKDIGFSIEGNPDYYKPTVTYGLCYYEGVWRFGTLIKNDLAWHKHKQKPRSFSNSLGMSMAKALVNIATKSNKSITLLDACCGVGTIMLEAYFAGNSIDGCDINWKACRDARTNLAHFDYTATVYRSDLKDLDQRYDAAIIDLPYNLFSKASDSDIVHIIESTAALSDRLIIVSTTDITDLIHNVGFTISDNCSVPKMGKTKFARKVWVCEKATEHDSPS